LLIAHLADTHLGLKQYGLPWREEDIYERFREAMEKAVREGVDAILISGDMFDRARPPIRAIKVAMETLELPRERGIPVYVILGEHDIPKTRDIPPQSILTYPKLLGTSKTEDMDTLVVDGREYVIAGASHYPAQEKYLRMLKGRLAMLASRVGGRRSVLMLHQSIRNIFAFEEGLDALEIPEAFTYVAMGHIHRRASLRLDGGRLLAYPGSIEILRSDEIGDWVRDGKGFYLVDLSGDEPEVQKVDLDVTPQARVKAAYPTQLAAVDAEAARLASRLRPGRRGILHVEVVIRADVKADPASQIRDRLSRRYGGSIYLRIRVTRVPVGAGEGVERCEGGVSEEGVVASLLSGGNPPAVLKPTIEKLARDVIRLKNVLAELDVGDPNSIVESIVSERDFWRLKVGSAVTASPAPPRKRVRGGLDAFLR